MERVKSLDGLRAISIIMVLLAHGSYSLPGYLTNNNFFQILASGHTGVMIFFVISGYLITKLLLIEKERNGGISIKNFYLRRIFRIFPVFYLYIIVVVILKNTSFPDIFTDYRTVFFASADLWNYKHLFTFIHLHENNGYWFFGHFWSLAMEEQFYLIWPFLFVKFGTASLRKIVFALILITPLMRFSTYFLFPNSRGQVDMMLHTGGDMILIGCFGALLEQSEQFSVLLKKKFFRNWAASLCFIFLFVINFYLYERFKGAYSVPIGHTLTGIAILYLLFWCIYVPTPVQTFLNYRIVKQIGLISYSLYIWQQLVFFYGNKPPVGLFPFNFIIVFALGFSSYYFVEKPVLKLKKRFERIKPDYLKKKTLQTENSKAYS